MMVFADHERLVTSSVLSARMRGLNEAARKSCGLISKTVLPISETAA